MRVGDLFEWVAAAALTAAGYLAPIGRWRLPTALLMATVCLFYFAQCYAAKEVPKVKLPKVRLHIRRPSPARWRARIIVSARLWRATHSN